MSSSDKAKRDEPSMKIGSKFTKSSMKNFGRSTNEKRLRHSELKPTKPRGEHVELFFYVNKVIVFRNFFEVKNVKYV